MTVKLGVVMDPITSIKPYKDSTLAMLLAAQRRNWQLYYMEQGDLYLRDGKVSASMRGLKVYDDAQHWYDLTDRKESPLAELDVILMRKDPPFNIEYIYTTQLLELAESSGVLIVNKPQGLRDANEKLATAWFPRCTAPTLVTRNVHQLRSFLSEHEDIILKPLDTMGGHSIFRVRIGDPNTSVILEIITRYATEHVMAQRFIPEITEGDKRILLIDGEPVPYMLARVPEAGETRGNLAAGGKGVGMPLGERDRWICSQVGPTLRNRGLLFAGLDVIGDYLTEVNITSPTCIRELDKLYSLDIAGQLLDCIAKKLGA